jgi:hypothetical protein
MKLIKQKAALLLTTTAALVSLFWITAFTAEDVTQREPSEALNAPEITAAHTSVSKTATAMDADGIIFILRQGNNG